MDVWVDFEDIPPASRWAEDLKHAIEGSDAFVFVISPDSVLSRECNAELERAADLNKRIVPLYLREVDPTMLLGPLSTHNWVPQLGLFEDDFAGSMESLVKAIETDLDWVGEHTRWGQKALEWQEHQRDRSFLLSGSELEAAEQWLARQSGKHPEPTGLQNTYVLASRQEATRRLRRTRAFVSVALVIAVVLSIVALVQRDDAVSNEHTAQSRQLAAEAESKLNSDPELSAELALRALDVRYTTQAEAALRDALPDVQELKTFTVGSPVNSAVFSADGTKLLIASDDGSARILQAATGKLLTIVHGAPLNGFRASYDPDASKFVTNSADGQATIWDAATGRRLLVLHGPDTAVNTATFSPDGTEVLTANANGTAIVWNASTGQQLKVIRYGAAFNDANFSPDGKQIVTADADNTAIVWNASSGKQLTTLKGHTAAVLTAAYNPQGTQIVTASVDETAIIFSAVTGQELAVLEGQADEINSAAFSPDGSEVVTASADGTAVVWGATPGPSGFGSELTVLRGHSAAVDSAAFSPNGREVVTAGDDGTVKLWTAATAERVNLLTGHSGAVTSSVFSPDGKEVLAGSDDGTAIIWNARSGRELEVLGGTEGPIFDAAFSPDGSRVITASSDAATVWSASSGRLLESQHYGATVGGVAISPDNTTALSALADGRAVIWNIDTGRQLEVLDGQAASAQADVLSALAGRVAVFSPNGREVVTAAGDDAIVWSVATGKELLVLRGHLATVTSAAFSRDGSKLVTGSVDGSGIVWDASSGRELAVLRGTSATVYAVAFSPDADEVVTAGADGSAVVWDVETAQPLTVFGGPYLGPVESVNGVAFNPDGAQVVSASDDGTVSVWSTELAGPIASVERLARQRITSTSATLMALAAIRRSPARSR